MAIQLAVDLGASKVVAGVLVDGEPVAIPFPGGALFTPSVGHRLADGRIEVGSAVQDLTVMDPQRVVLPTRTGIGSSYAAPLAGGELDAELVLSELLASAIREVEAHLGTSVDGVSAVIPAGASTRYRMLVERALQRVHPRPLRIRSSPAAVAAILLSRQPADEMALVIDLGAATTEVAVVEIGDGVAELQSVRHARVGGDDVDTQLAAHLLHTVYERHGIDLR